MEKTTEVFRIQIAEGREITVGQEQVNLLEDIYLAHVLSKNTNNAFSVYTLLSIQVERGRISRCEGLSDRELARIHDRLMNHLIGLGTDGIVLAKSKSQITFLVPEFVNPKVLKSLSTSSPITDKIKVSDLKKTQRIEVLEEQEPVEHNPISKKVSMVEGLPQSKVSQPSVQQQEKVVNSDNGKILQFSSLQDVDKFSPGKDRNHLLILLQLVDEAIKHHSGNGVALDQFSTGLSKYPDIKPFLKKYQEKNTIVAVAAWLRCLSTCNPALITYQDKTIVSLTNEGLETLETGKFPIGLVSPKRKKAALPAPIAPDADAEIPSVSSTGGEGVKEEDCLVIKDSSLVMDDVESLRTSYSEIKKDLVFVLEKKLNELNQDISKKEEDLAEKLQQLDLLKEERLKIFCEIRGLKDVDVEDDDGINSPVSESNGLNSSDSLGCDISSFGDLSMGASK